MMIKTFTMKLYPGMEQEYAKRHSALWPEMKEAIHAHGGRNYTISLDPETLVLYAYIEIEDADRWDALADTPVNRRWWEYMADIMETNPDSSPVTRDLTPVFHLD